MPTQNSSNQKYSNNADGFTMGGGTIQRNLILSGADVTLTGSGSNTFTYPSNSDTIVGRNSIDALANKSLVAPKIDQIKDTNGNLNLVIDPIPSAVNYMSVGNAVTNQNVYIDAVGSDTNIGIDIGPKGNKPVTIWTTTGNTPTLSAAGADTNLSLNLTPKGTGTVNASGIPVVTTTATQNLSGKTLTAPVLSGSVTGTYTLAGTPTFPSTVVLTTGTQSITGVKTLTTPVFSGLPTGSGVSSSALVSTLAARDANKNLLANSFIPGFTTTVTSGVTTTLTVSATGSTQIQVFTGSSIQTVALPSASVVAGLQYTIINNSTGIVTVNASSSGTVATLSGNTSAIITAVAAAPTTSAGWTAQVIGGGSASSSPRVTTVTSSATPAYNTDSTDILSITALATAITSMSASMTGTAANGQKLLIRIKDNGTAQSITWGSAFISSGVATLITTTVASNTHNVGLIYDSVAAKWICMAADAAGY